MILVTVSCTVLSISVHSSLGTIYQIKSLKPIGHLHCVIRKDLIQVVLVVKNLSANARDIRNEGSVLSLERFTEKGHNSLQCSCMGNPINRGTWWATVHGVPESDITEAA